MNIAAHWREGAEIPVRDFYRRPCALKRVRCDPLTLKTEGCRTSDGERAEQRLLYVHFIGDKIDPANQSPPENTTFHLSNI